MTRATNAKVGSISPTSPKSREKGRKTPRDPKKKRKETTDVRTFGEVVLLWTSGLFHT
jgi:hypothetical protein